MNGKNLLESVSASVNDELRLRNEYLVAENRILRKQIEGRVQLSDSERKELAEIGVKLGKQALAEIATIAQADTILAWHRKFTNQKVNTSVLPKSVGRPRMDQEIEDWVIRMARENRSWGYDRIAGALANLGDDIGDQTMRYILKRRGIPFRGDTPPRDDRPAASHDQIISHATFPVHTHVAPTRALATPARPHR